MKIGFNEANDRFCKDHTLMKDLEYCESMDLRESIFSLSAWTEILRLGKSRWRNWLTGLKTTM